MEMQTWNIEVHIPERILEPEKEKIRRIFEHFKEKLETTIERDRNARIKVKMFMVV